MLQNILAKVIGTQNERDLKKLRPIVAQVNALETIHAGVLAHYDLPRIAGEMGLLLDGPLPVQHRRRRPRQFTLRDPLPPVLRVLGLDRLDAVPGHQRKDA